MANNKPETKNKENQLIGIKDSPGRSLAKAVSWRIIASITTFLITFTIVKIFTDKTLDETLETSFWVLFFDVIIKIIIYYLHERMWTNIVWGKYWKRYYWKQRAWKKLYRSKHND